MWPALLVLAASAFLNYQNNRAAQKRQQRIAGAMEAFQRKKSAESMAATEELLEKQTPEARAGELQRLTADREQSLRDTVGAAQAFDVPQIAGKLSADHVAASEREANVRAERLRRAIEQLSTMGAPGEQRQQHQLRFGRAAGQVDAANIASDAVGRGYMTDINNVRPNPFIGLVSQIGMGVGAGMMGNAAAGAASAGAVDAGVNAGQGYEDAAGNLYDPAVANRQDARIQRQLAQRRAFSIWGGNG